MKLKEFLKSSSSKLEKNRYPTKEEIESNEISFEYKFIEVLKKWKKKEFKNKWKEKKTAEKNDSLVRLIIAIIRGYNKIYNNNDKIVLPKIYSTAGAYGQMNNVIYLNHNNPSIISTLHETAHQLFPEHGELMACVFSYSLFKRVFPAQIKNLVWDGYLLKKCQ